MHAYIRCCKSNFGVLLLDIVCEIVLLDFPFIFLQLDLLFVGGSTCFVTYFVTLPVSIYFVFVIYWCFVNT